jgi:hypothetical protein
MSTTAQTTAGGSPHPRGEDDTTPHLTTGWEPGLDVGDSMLRRYLFHNADLTTAIATAAGGEVLVRDDVVAADLRRPSGYWNAATLLQPPEDVDGLLADLEAFYRPGRGEVALWSAWPLPDLRDRGWALSGHPPLLIRPPGDGPAGDAGAADVERVEDPSTLRRWEEVAVRGYPMPELAGEPPGAVAPPGLLDDPRVGFWAGPDTETVHAVAMGFRARGLGSLALGVTLPDHRHAGSWQALCAARLRWIGEDWAAGVFSDFSRRGAERLGFVPVTRLTLWTRPRP